MIAIIGGGISGLVLGLELHAAGIDYIILEADDRVGGVIRTCAHDGLRMECGPQRVRSCSELDGFLPSAEACHHSDPHEPVFVAKGRRLHPLPRTLRDALLTPALSWPGKARAALEPLAAVGADPEVMSAGAFLRKRVGREAYKTFLGPLFGGIYGSDPDRMDAHRTLGPAMAALGAASFGGHLRRASLRRISRGRSGEEPLLTRPIVVPHGGMEMLPRRLLGMQPDRVHTLEPVGRIEALAGGGFRVHGRSRIVEAGNVVLTVPPDAAARLLKPLAPGYAAAVGLLRMNPLAVIHLDTPELPAGLGFQVAFGEPARIRGATFAGNLDGSGRGAAVYMGGMADPGVTDAPDTELAADAARDFERFTGIPGRSVHVHRTRMPAWDRSWRALDGLAPPEGVHLLTGYTGRPGIVGRVREARALAGALATQRGG